MASSRVSMARSRRLITASYILSFIAANAPCRMQTDRIAEKVQAHPTRVRHLVSQLVKARILTSHRGSAGGLSLDRSPAEITLKDVYEAVQGGPLIAEAIENPFAEWQEHCRVYPVFEMLFSTLEEQVRSKFAEITLDQLFVPNNSNNVGKRITMRDVAES